MHGTRNRCAELCEIAATQLILADAAFARTGASFHVPAPAHVDSKSGRNLGTDCLDIDRSYDQSLSIIARIGLPYMCIIAQLSTISFKK